MGKSNTKLSERKHAIFFSICESFKPVFFENKKKFYIFVVFFLFFSIFGGVFFLKPFYDFKMLCYEKSGFKVERPILKNQGWMALEFFNAMILAGRSEHIEFVRFNKFVNNELVEFDMKYIGGPEDVKTSYEVESSNTKKIVKYDLITYDYEATKNENIKKQVFNVYNFSSKENDAKYIDFSFNYFGKTFKCRGPRYFLNKFELLFDKKGILYNE